MRRRQTDCDQSFAAWWVSGVWVLRVFEKHLAKLCLDWNHYIHAGCNNRYNIPVNPQAPPGTANSDPLKHLAWGSFKGLETQALGPWGVCTFLGYFIISHYAGTARHRHFSSKLAIAESLRVSDFWDDLFQTFLSDLIWNCDIPSSIMNGTGILASLSKFLND